jgi:outer membrane protein assembly factor BamD (BamD/ComL family)
MIPKERGSPTMAKQKIKRKELLKSPDEFLTFSERAFNYIRNRARHFEYAGMAVAAAAVVYLAVTTYLNYVHRQGQGAYNAAYSEITEDKTDFEKTEALFRKVEEEHGLSRVSRLVPPQLGYLEYRQKQYGEAVTHYEIFVKELSRNSPYRYLSRLALAAVHEEKGEPDRAVSILNDLKSDPENVFMEQTLLSLARVYRLSKQDDKAKEVYREFIDRFKASPFLPQAKAYLNEQLS